MIKISTLYKKNPDNLALVVNEINPENEWVFTDKGVKATRKFDGMACAIIGGTLYKRRDVKKGKLVPAGAIPCQENPDNITGHWPHWILCDRTNKEDKYFFEAFDQLNDKVDGTYELCGETISTKRFTQNFNAEKIDGHKMIMHGSEDLFMSLRIKKPDGTYLYDFEHFKKILSEEDIEGIVFHHPDGRMCKLRKSDFGIKRQSYADNR